MAYSTSWMLTCTSVISRSSVLLASWFGAGRESWSVRSSAKVFRRLGEEPTLCKFFFALYIFDWRGSVAVWFVSIRSALILTVSPKSLRSETWCTYCTVPNFGGVPCFLRSASILSVNLARATTFIVCVSVITNERQKEKWSSKQIRRDSGGAHQDKPVTHTRGDTGARPVPASAEAGPDQGRRDCQSRCEPRQQLSPPGNAAGGSLQLEVSRLGGSQAVNRMFLAYQTW